MTEWRSCVAGMKATSKRFAVSGPKRQYQFSSGPIRCTLRLPLDLGKRAVATKTAETQSCPGCGSPAKIDGGARRWRVLCSKNTQTLHSPCDKAGHPMFSKTDAVRVWNELK